MEKTYIIALSSNANNNKINKQNKRRNGLKKIFNIHNHSTYSIFDGVSTPEDWAKYIADHKDEFYQGISLSEHGVLNGGYETFNFAQKNNLKYVPSIEFYVVPNGTDLTEKKVERYHLLVLGLDLEGYKQIVRINNMAIKRKQYILSRTGKFFVCITPDILEEVVKNNQGHLLCFGACIQGYWNKPVTELNNDLAKERLIEMIEIFGDENVFLESQTYDSPEQKMVNKFNKEIENEVGLKCVITSDAHIIRKEDKIYQILATIMLLKNNLAGYNAMLAKDDREMEYRSWYKNYNELLYDIENLDLGLNKNDLDRYCDTLSDLYEKIDPNINLRNEQKFIYGDGNQDENLDKFYNLIYNGWKERFGDKEMDDKYYKRLEYEMNIIKDKGFVDYFLEVRGIIQLGLKNDIIFGVGRGSAASSLISYLLEITNIDPLKYGLIFERFITPSRKDYPDIDCDLSNKTGIINLLKEKYPNKDIVVIANKGKFGIKTITNSIFKALDIRYPYDDYFKSSQYYTKIIEKYELDQYDIDKFFELKEIEDLVRVFDSTYNHYDLKTIYKLYIKNLSNVGVHAGGVCILDEKQDMIPYIPVKSEDYNFATAYSESGSYKELEEMGEIKFDLLGIKTLEIFNDCINFIGDQSLRELLFFNNVDVNDKKVYERISTTLTDGFFQLGSEGMKNLIKILNVDNIEDLSILIALYRPGTLNAGVQNTIGRAKTDKEYGKSLWDKNVLPLIEDVIESTYYHILYQEQVMFIGQRIGDYDMVELNNFRKFISNKNLKDIDPEKYEILKEKFYSTFISNGKRKSINEVVLEELWAKLEGFSAYSFVKCLDPNTLVHTVDGLKEIKYVKEGDIVLSYDIDEKEIIETKVKSKIRSKRKTIYSIKTDRGDTVKCTLEHKFLTKKFGMKSLKEIIENDMELKEI